MNTDYLGLPKLFKHVPAEVKKKETASGIRAL